LTAPHTGYLSRLPHRHLGLCLYFMPFGLNQPFWPMNRAGEWVSKSAVMLTSLQDPEVNEIRPSAQWVCAVLVDGFDKELTLRRLERAVSHASERKGWVLVKTDGGCYPTPEDCKEAWAATL